MDLKDNLNEAKRSLLFVSFNQDSSSLSVGTKDGYQLYSLGSIDILESIHTNDADSDVYIVARLFSSSLLALVSSKAPRRLKVCHFKKNTEICNYSYSNNILAVKLNRQRLVVCLEESIYIHSIRDMKVIHTIRSTPKNPRGLCDLSTNNDCSYLAFPNSASTGIVQIFDTVTLRALQVLSAHDNPLAALAFNVSGNKIATASDKGTVIRVFSLPEGEKLFEFRRGVKRCVRISSLSFSADSLFLAASSDTETVHIFKLEHKEEKPVEEHQTWTGYVTSAFRSSASYLPSQMTEVFNQFRAHATCRLAHAGLKTLCTLTTINKVPYVLVVSEDGILSIFTMDPVEGGDCQRVKIHSVDPGCPITDPDDEEGSAGPSGDRPLTSPNRADKSRTKSSSESAASDSQSYQDMEPGGSPPSELKLDDDSEFPPMSHDA